MAGWIHDVSFNVLMLLGVLPSTIAFAMNAPRSKVWRRWDAALVPRRQLCLTRQYDERGDRPARDARVGWWPCCSRPCSS
ncbi:MAG: hypothetical protein M3130_04365 [Actinomycetota bacterium]|nr:hypothetical protein [Actinomycetota bacterium]